MVKNAKTIGKNMKKDMPPISLTIQKKESENNTWRGEY